MEFDDELLELAVQRRPVFTALAEEPRHRRELQEELDLSKTTCHRIIRSLDEWDLVQRSDRGYQLTELGRVVEAQVRNFDRTVRTACRLRPLLDAFGAAEVDFEVELFSDATVTRPEPEDPTPPISRYLELFRAAESVRTLDRTSFIPPLYIEEIFELALEDGKHGLAIYPPSVVRKRYDEYPDIHRRAVAREGRPLYRVYDAVPFGLTLYDDDRVALRAYDDETGALVLLADTGDPDAVSWAEDVFRHYYERSAPPDAFDEFPEWVPAVDDEP